MEALADWVILNWRRVLSWFKDDVFRRSFINAGKPSAYRILRRERPAGPWTDVATAITCEATLLDQPRGKEFEYRIIAVNKAGAGEPSNTVVVVL